MPQPSKFRCPRCKFRHSKDCGFEHGVETFSTDHCAGVMIRCRRCPRCKVEFKTYEKTGPVVEYLNEGLPLDELPEVEPVVVPVFYQNRFPGMIPASEVVDVG